MTKIEVIWREILFQARENRKVVFTQKELAVDFGFSLSTVFQALKIPRASHIIQVSNRNFRLDSYQKLLYLWASHRAMHRDILYRAHIDLDAKNIEARMPPLARFALYSAYAFFYRETPADYDHVYVYVSPVELPGILQRFEHLDSKHAAPNLFILRQDEWLSRYAQMPPEHIFVDIWNAPEWYAKDFLKALEPRLPF